VFITEPVRLQFVHVPLNVVTWVMMYAGATESVLQFVHVPLNVVTAFSALAPLRPSPLQFVHVPLNVVTPEFQRSM